MNWYSGWAGEGETYKGIGKGGEINIEYLPVLADEKKERSEVPQAIPSGL